MTTTSRAAVLKKAIGDALRTALPTVTVIDGPLVQTPDGDYITVGWTPEGDRTTTTQDWGQLGNRARDEMIDVPCYCDSYSGSTDSETRIADAYALLASAENILRQDPTLGGVLPGPGWAWLSATSELDEQSPEGSFVGITFHVSAKTRI